MPFETKQLVTGALTDVESVADYLKLKDRSGDNWLAAFINEATGVIERRTRRRLLTRTYDGTAGNQPLFLLNGDGSDSIIIPEWPVTAVSSIRERDESDAYTPMVTTSMRFGASGVVTLPNDTFTEGVQNIEVKCTAGYVAGVHDADLAALEQACKRLVQVLYQDWDTKVGRGTNLSMQGFQVSLVNLPLPKDVEDIVQQYARLT